jgi:hypothetical protein
LVEIDELEPLRRCNDVVRPDITVCDTACVQFAECARGPNNDARSSSETQPSLELVKRRAVDSSRQKSLYAVVSEILGVNTKVIEHLLLCGERGLTRPRSHIGRPQQRHAPVEGVRPRVADPATDPDHLCART